VVKCTFRAQSAGFRRTSRPGFNHALREEPTTPILPARTRLQEATDLEHHLAHLVREAYHLTPEEIDLLWRTAPPRMPI
jgi:hypothetical protein